MPDDGFGGRSYDKLFLKLRGRIHDNALSVRVVHEPVMGDDGALLGESFHVLSFFA
jgi:hypothetical protein